MSVSELKELLSEFEVVASDAVPTVSLDRQRRFYINTSLRRLLGVKPYERLAIAYNVEERELAIIRPSIGLDSVIDDELLASVYTIDKRYYMSARHFAKRYGYTPAKAPYFFEYKRSISNLAFVFRLNEGRTR